MKKVFILSFAVLSLISCKKNDDNGGDGIFKGPEVKVHEGKAWTWLKLNKQGQPEKLAVAVNEKALNSVPVGGESGHGHSAENHFILKLHPKADVLQIDHVGLDWNPSGHEPEPIYGKPHFDFHFYMVTPEYVAAIPPYEEDSEKFDNWPPAEYFPANYINPGGGVPQMGAHWIDATSPELNGQPFTETFLYGSYDGNVIFIEPMITLEFLKNTNNFERTIPQPAKVQKTGWYPTKMKVQKQNNVTEVVLEGFVHRTQS